MNRLYFDGEEDQWKFQPLVPTGGYVPGPDPDPDPRSALALLTHGHEASACRAGMSPGMGGRQGPRDACRCLRVEILSKPSPTRKGHPSLAVDKLHSSLFGCGFSRYLCSLTHVPLLINFLETATK